MTKADQILTKEMQMSKRSITLITLGVALFYAVSIAFCYWVHFTSREIVSGQAIRSITNISQLNKDSVYRAITNHKMLLESIARRMEKHDLEQEPIPETLEYLQDLTGPYEFYTVGVLDENGTVYLTNGEVRDARGNPMTDAAWTDHFLLSESYMPFDGGQNAINLFSCPVYSHGELKYVLLASYYSDRLTDRMNTSSMGSSGYTFLLNRAGEVVICPRIYGGEAYTELMQYIHDTPEIVPNTAEDTRFTYNGEAYYAHSEELGINDWYLMTCAREWDLFADARAISVVVYIAVAVVWVLILLVVGLNFYLMRRRRLKRTRELYYDEFLGIPNMTALKVCFHRFLAEHPQDLYLSVFDIDRFKEFNYLYGRDNGDKVLQYLVKVMCTESPRGFFFRYVSDRFVVLDTSPDDATLEHRIQMTLARFEQDIKAGIIPPFEISIGVRRVEPGEPLGEIISDAMIARETVRGDHNCHYAFYDRRIRTKRLKYVEMENTFPTALRNGEFHVYYQPKFNMETGEVLGSEALARWIRPDGTFISPGDFIPCFEASQQISQLDEEILTQVCRDMHAMQLEGLPIKPVSVNLSRVHLSHPELLPRISGIVRDTGIDAANLSFEITEIALLEESIPLRSIVDELRALGCRVDMDDYGVGASGPRALASNCFDVVKLDKSFVDDIGDGQVEAVIEATINLAKKLGLEVLAEGVEEQYQATRLMDLGCFRAQGFFYSRPLPVDGYRRILQQGRVDTVTAAPASLDPEKRSHPYFSEDFCNALDSTEAPIYIVDPTGYEILYCNKNLSQYLGCTPLGKRCYRAVRGLDSPCPDCGIVRLFKEGINEPVEIQLKDGSWRLVKASPIHWRGRRLYKMSWFDITRQKQLESDLRLRSKEYAAVVERSTSGIIRYDLATRTATTNIDSNLNTVEEYRIENYCDAICASGFVAPESIPVVQAMFADIHAGKPSAGYDICLKAADDRLRWCHSDYTLISDDAGKPYRAVSFFYDNTERRQQELEYQKWHNRVNTLVEEYLSYLEVNLTRDLVEAEAQQGVWIEIGNERRFGTSTEEIAASHVYPEDQFSFRRFLSRERLLGQFMAGTREGSLEYRATFGGPIQWHKAEFQLVSDPDTGDVKASILISNVDSYLKEQSRLKNEAERDAMTGLYNHATAETLIRQVLELSTAERCCFLIIDLDDLREINSELGHPEGDRALKAIADCMRAQFRKSDILGRVGGDEFVVLLRSSPEAENLQAALSGFVRRLNEVKIGPRDNRPVRASIGCAMGTAGADDFDSLYRKADLALYYTKAKGKNGFCFYTPELEQREFSYTPSTMVGLMGMDFSQAAEVKTLLQAVSAFCPMVISANLTQNRYTMLEQADYVKHHANSVGVYDALIQEGYNAFVPEDREGFFACFGRENMLQAYADGKHTIEHIGRQIGDDGLVRRMRTVSTLMLDKSTGDICEVSFSHAMPGEEPQAPNVPAQGADAPGDAAAANACTTAADAPDAAATEAAAPAGSEALAAKDAAPQDDGTAKLP